MAHFDNNDMTTNDQTKADKRAQNLILKVVMDFVVFLFTFVLLFISLEFTNNNTYIYDIGIHTIHM